jgi:uncharacterized protein with HEPN domain
MSRDVGLYLEDILLACQKIHRYTAGMSLADFKGDERTYDAVIRNLEIIGEAAGNVEPEFHAQYPEVEWRPITAFQQILAQGYFSIKDAIVWDSVQNKVPQLEELIWNLLEGLKR